MTIPLIVLSVLSLGIVFTFNPNPLDAHGWFDHSLGKVEHVAGQDMYKYKDGLKGSLSSDVCFIDRSIFRHCII